MSGRASGRRWLRLLQFLLGFGVVLGLAKLAGPVSVFFENRKLPDGWRILRPPHEVSALALQGNLLWAGGTDGLWAIGRESGGFARLPRLPRITAVRDLAVTETGAVWVAHREGLTRISDGAARTWTSAGGLQDGALTALCPMPDGRLWIGGESGLSVLEGDSFRRVADTAQLGIEGVDVIYPDEGGALWLASMAPLRGGLLRYDGSRFENWTGRPQFAHPAVNAILRSRDGTLWFGAGFGRRGGASAWKDGAWRMITKEGGLAGEKVRSLFEDRKGRLWIGSEYDGIAVFDGSRSRILTPAQGLSGWEVKEMVEDGRGVLWLATEDGITRIERFE